MSIHNMPSDVRNFDNDPRSPFYDDPTEAKTELWLAEVENDPDYISEAFGDNEEELNQLFTLVHELTYSKERDEIIPEIRQLTMDVAKKYADHKVEIGDESIYPDEDYS